MHKRKKKPTLVVVNDNHAVCTSEGLIKFERSQFHHFLRSFNRFSVFLSAPVKCNPLTILPNKVNIDGVTILPRPAYESIYNFYKSFPISIISQIKSLRQHLRAADVVLLVYPSAMLLPFLLINRRRRLPYGMYLIGNLEEIISSSSKYSGWKKILGMAVARFEWWLVRKLANNSGVVFALGSELQKKCARSGFHTIPAITSLVSEKEIAVPADKPIKPPVRILTVSRLSYEKNIEIAVKALAGLATRGVELEYVIVGEGPWRVNIEQEVAKHPQLAGKVFFRGWLEPAEVKAEYKNADIFVLPSSSEGIPKVILDAMAAAIPVLATNVGGIPDLIGERRGWLFPAGNVEALTEAFLECLQNDSERHERIWRAHNFIKSHTQEAEAEKIQRYLLSIIETTHLCSGLN